MKKIFILSMLIVLSCGYAYGWEMYVTNESANSITVYTQAGVLIDTITDPSIFSPRQLVFRENGNLYVACGSSKIVIIDPNRNVIGSIDLPFQGGGLAIGSNNHLYVGLTNTPAGSTIQEYDENDNFVESFNGGIASLKPDAMTIGNNDNLFVADNGHSQVVEFDLTGNLINKFSTGAASYPRGISFGPDGFIYVAGDGMNNVSVFDPNTFIRTRTITGVTAPYGITFDPENHHLFVANFGAGNILEYLYTGEFQKIFVSGLSAPDHIAFKSQSTLITLASFMATPKAGQVILAWSTASEIDNAGFNLYRSSTEDGEYIKIDTALIPAKGSSTQGANYEFIDAVVQNRKTYYYKLEDIDLSGKSTMHGPIKAMPRWWYGVRE